MKHKHGNIYFIDKHNYEALCGIDLSIEEIVGTIAGADSVQDNIRDNKVSAFTMLVLYYVHKKVSGLFDYDAPQAYCLNRNDCLRPADADEAIREGDAIINSEPKLDYDYGEVEKYYELTSLPSGDILVIMQDGFIRYLTESKDNYKQFLLDCLCKQYKFNTGSWSQFRCYLNLRIVPNYIETVKLRFN